jgi:4-carboxymuconolactone decarboxylase
MMDLKKSPDAGRNRTSLIRLSAALASREDGLLREAMADAELICDPVEVEEVILQSYLFLGYPISLNAFGLWREVSKRESGPGAEDDWPAWIDRGRGVCSTVYGGAYEGLRRNVRALHPDMERWMVVEGYGKVLGRPGLDLVSRELCIVALLAVLGTPRQLYSHLRGALNAGAEPLAVEESLGIIRGYLDDTGWGEVWEVWCRVRARPHESHSAHRPEPSD